MKKERKEILILSRDTMFPVLRTGDLLLTYNYYMRYINSWNSSSTSTPSVLGVGIPRVELHTFLAIQPMQSTCTCTCTCSQVEFHVWSPTSGFLGMYNTISTILGTQRLTLVEFHMFFPCLVCHSWGPVDKWNSRVEFHEWNLQLSK